jgi:hypothetical protein
MQIRLILVQPMNTATRLEIPFWHLSGRIRAVILCRTDLAEFTAQHLLGLSPHRILPRIARFTLFHYAFSPLF